MRMAFRRSWVPEQSIFQTLWDGFSPTHWRWWPPALSRREKTRQIPAGRQRRPPLHSRFAFTGGMVPVVYNLSARAPASVRTLRSTLRWLPNRVIRLRTGMVRTAVRRALARRLRNIIRALWAGPGSGSCCVRRSTGRMSPQNSVVKSPIRCQRELPMWLTTVPCMRLVTRRPASWRVGLLGRKCLDATIAAREEVERRQREI